MESKHRKQRRSYNEAGHAHFLTYSCKQRWPLLSKDLSRQWVIHALDATRRTLSVAIWAYVVMPEHVHLLVVPQEPDYEMRRILAALKAPVSRKAKAHLERTANTKWLQRLTVQRGNRTVFQYWQPGGGYDENLWRERPICEVIDYIHLNPVRRKLVETPTDWKWSSARAHAGLEGSPLPVDRVDFG